MAPNGLSLITTADKNLLSLSPLIKQLHNLFSPTPLKYEVLIVGIYEKSDSLKILDLSEKYSVNYIASDHEKKRNQSLVKALPQCSYNIIALLQNPESYSLKTIIEMAKKVYSKEA